MISTRSLDSRLRGIYREKMFRAHGLLIYGRGLERDSLNLWKAMSRA